RLTLICQCCEGCCLFCLTRPTGGESHFSFTHMHLLLKYLIKYGLEFMHQSPYFFGRLAMGGSTVNRGHAHHRSIRRCRVREGRPRRFGGAQRDSGTGNDSSSCIVQQWSVIPVAMAGVVCCVWDKL